MFVAGSNKKIPGKRERKKREKRKKRKGKRREKETRKINASSFCVPSQLIDLARQCFTNVVLSRHCCK